MNARVSRWTGLTPERLQEAVRWFQDERQLERFEAEAGFDGMIVAVNWISGAATAITLWESEPAMRASEKAADEVRSAAVEAGGGVQEQLVDRYEVVVERFPARAG